MSLETLALLGHALLELRGERGCVRDSGSDAMERSETRLGAAGLLNKRLTSKRDG